jgi:hypothetical protein
MKTSDQPRIEEVDLDLDLPADDERQTYLWLRAVAGEIDNSVSDVEPAPVAVSPVSVVSAVSVLSPVAVVEPSEPVPADRRAERIISEVARSAEESARYQHRRVVVAPLLMLLALGLLFAAAGSSC